MLSSVKANSPIKIVQFKKMPTNKISRQQTKCYKKVYCCIIIKLHANAFRFFTFNIFEWNNVKVGSILKKDNDNALPLREWLQICPVQNKGCYLSLQLLLIMYKQTWTSCIREENSNSLTGPTL